MHFCYCFVVKQLFFQPEDKRHCKYFLDFPKVFPQYLLPQALIFEIQIAIHIVYSLYRVCIIFHLVPLHVIYSSNSKGKDLLHRKYLCSIFLLSSQTIFSWSLYFGFQASMVGSAVLRSTNKRTAPLTRRLARHLPEASGSSTRGLKIEQHSLASLPRRKSFKETRSSRVPILFIAQYQ